MVKKNSCIFISGNGSNLKKLLYRASLYHFPINIKMIVSNKKNANGLIYAKRYSVPHFIIDTENKLSEIKILNELKKRKVTLICLAGYMKILSKFFINSFQNKIINIHPSILPKFKGINTFTKVLRNSEIKTGCTVHFVNKKLDSGKIILNKKFFINKRDNVQSLKKKTQYLEYFAYSEAIIKIYNYS